MTKLQTRASDNEDIDVFLELTRQAPEVQFIVAHSLNSYDLVNDLKRKISGQKNIWIEVSTSLTNLVAGYFPGYTNVPEWEQYVESWRRFGIDRILFGSDQSFGRNKVYDTEFDNGEMFEQQLHTIRNNSFLTEAEKSKILFSNGIDFLKSLTEKAKK